MGQATGKPTKIKKSKIHRDDRPYMFLERDILEEVKKRPSYDALTKEEYFAGMSALVKEKVDPLDPAYHFIEHMAMVAEDALEHAWEGVRKWSNMVFDKVEKRRISWQDRQEIKEMRYGVSWIKGSSVTRDQAPCHEFNVEGRECEKEDEHTDDKYTYRHRCAACWHGLNLYDCKHPATLCKRKKGMQYKYNEAQVYKDEQKGQTKGRRYVLQQVQAGTRCAKKLASQASPAPRRVRRMVAQQGLGRGIMATIRSPTVNNYNELQSRLGAERVNYSRGNWCKGGGLDMVEAAHTLPVEHKDSQGLTSQPNNIKSAAPYRPHTAPSSHAANQGKSTPRHTSPRGVECGRAWVHKGPLCNQSDDRHLGRLGAGVENGVNPNRQQDSSAVGVASNTSDNPVGINPPKYHHITQHPTPDPCLPPDIAGIFTKVVKMGCPNAAGARIPVASSLNIPIWKSESTGHTADEFVLRGVEFGFSLQYTGPAPHQGRTRPPNHTSARDYPAQVKEYIIKERAEGALIGPLPNDPFKPWCVFSPIMSRPKDNGKKRRIIADLSFPDGGVNKYIPKNVVEGKEVVHSLPTIQTAIALIHQKQSPSIYMAAIDVSRAYRNFRTCPAGWPFMAIHHAMEAYLDIALPFGARASSYSMQQVAGFITRALEKRGATSLMYLDDLLIVASSHDEAKYQYTAAQDLITDLGLPIAQDKLQPPARKLVWLGIEIDMDKNTIAIPQPKLQEIKTTLRRAHTKDRLTVKEVQSIVGSINHLGKAVQPAGLFMGRILDALREADGTHVWVDHHVRADLRWFNKYLEGYNGRSLIPPPEPSMDIYADACTQGFGAHTQGRAYGVPISEEMTQAHSISELECLNCLVAARTFLTRRHRGRRIRINCDNEPTIFAYTGGKARNKVLAACARALWMLSATLEIAIVFRHIPGVNMTIADALSRAHTARSYRDLASEYIHNKSLLMCKPCTTAYNYIDFV